MGPGANKKNKKVLLLSRSLQLGRSRALKVILVTKKCNSNKSLIFFLKDVSILNLPGSIGSCLPFRSQVQNSKLPSFKLKL